MLIMQKSNLKRHQKIHTKEKPFLCNECKKGFATTTNLKQHLQIHLVEVEQFLHRIKDQFFNVKQKDVTKNITTRVILKNIKNSMLMTLQSSFEQILIM